MSQASMSAASTVSEISRRRIDQINKQIDDIAASVKNIADASSRNKLESRLVVVKSKRERLRSMASIARLKRIHAELDIIIEGTEIGIELTDLKRSWSDLDTRGSKRVKPNEEKSADAIPASKQTSSKSRRSSTKKDEDRTKDSSSKSQRHDRQTEKTQTEDESVPRKSSTPQKQEKTQQSKHRKRTEDKPKSKPSTKPAGSAVSKFISTTGKPTILLDSPPVRDSPKMAANVGYYTSDYTKHILGYIPKDLTVNEKENAHPYDGYQRFSKNLHNQQKFPNRIQSKPLQDSTNVNKPRIVSAINKEKMAADQQTNSQLMYNSNVNQESVCNQNSCNRLLLNNKQPYVYECHQNNDLTNQRNNFQRSINRVQLPPYFNQQVNICIKNSNCNLQNIVADPCQVAGSSEMQIQDNTTNILFKEIMDRKVVHVKTEPESLSSVKTLIIQAGWD